MPPVLTTLTEPHGVTASLCFVSVLPVRSLLTRASRSPTVTVLPAVTRIFPPLVSICAVASMVTTPLACRSMVLPASDVCSLGAVPATLSSITISSAAITLRLPLVEVIFFLIVKVASVPSPELSAVCNKILPTLPVLASVPLTVSAPSRRSSTILPPVPDAERPPGATVSASLSCR